MIKCKLTIQNLLNFLCIILISTQSFGQNFFIPETITYKKFKNGFSYYIIPNGEPGKIGIYVLNNTGALVEKPQERGVAHFLEHMVFKGSKNFPGNQTAETLERMGLRIGRDFNGSVNDTHTEYRIFIPENNKSILNKTLDLMKDWCFNLEMGANDLEVEKKVVIEEIKLRPVGGTPFLMGTYLEGHNGLGTKEQINSVTAQDVKNFYNKYYTPDQLTLVVNGKVNEKEVAQYIEKLFANVPPTTNKITNKYLDLSTETIVDSTYKMSDKNKTSFLVLGFKTQDFPVTSYESYKKDLIYNLFCKMLENRLDQLPNSNFDKVDVTNAKPLPGNLWFNFRLDGKDNASYNAMLNDFCFTLAQARKFGFLEDEIKYFANYFLDRYKASKQDANSYSDIKRSFLTGDALLTTKDRIAITEKIVNEITPTDFNDLLNSFTDYNKTILFDNTSAFESDFTKNYILNQLKNINSFNSNVTPYKFKTPRNVFLVQNSTDLPTVKIETKKAVKIEKKTTLGDYLYELKYPNGIRVVVNSAPNAENQIKIIGNQGLNSIPKEDRTLFKASIKIFDNTYGDYSEKEASTLQRNLKIYNEVAIGNYDYEFNLKGTKEDFLQLFSIFNLIVNNTTVPNTINFNKSFETQLKRGSKSKDEIQDFIDEINGLALDIPESDQTQLDEETIKRLANYNQIFKHNFKNSYIYVGGTLPENVDELISTYIASIPSPKLEVTKVDKKEPLYATQPTTKEFTWNTKSTKDNFMFSRKSDKLVTFKDKLIANGIAEFGYKRMFEILRKKYGFIYSLGTTGYTNKNQNLSSVSIRYIVQDATNTSKARTAMIEEVLTPMSKAELSDNDIHTIKALLEQNYVANFYENERVSSEYLKWGLDYGKLYTIEEFQKMIRKISTEEIKQQMKHTINLNKYYNIIQSPKK